MLLVGLLVIHNKAMHFISIIHTLLQQNTILSDYGQLYYQVEANDLRANMKPY